jgi:AraC-like DNA-binding protein
MKIWDSCEIIALSKLGGYREMSLASSPAVRFYLWNGKALYLGMGLPSGMHQHHAIQIGLSFTEALKIRSKETDSYQECTGFIAYPNLPHQVDSSGVSSLFLWLEAENPVARFLAQHPSRNESIEPLSTSQYEQIFNQLSLFGMENLDCKRAENLSEIILDLLIEKQPVLAALDSRVLNLMERIKDENRMEHPDSVDGLAAELHLSSSRLRHLFQGELGISIQRYLLWQRLNRAIALAAKGQSLTNAAHEAGFADSAHLSRSFRSIFGISPSEIFKDSHLVQVQSCAL